MINMRWTTTVEEPEVMDAAINDYGTVIRYSDTIEMDLVYVAKKIQYQDDIIYFRLAVALKTVMQEFLYAMGAFWPLSFLSLSVLGLVFAYKLSKKIQYDIKQITDYLKRNF